MFDFLLAPFRRFKPRDWLVILGGLFVGLAVSAMFKSMTLKETRPQAERPGGPITSTQAPLAFSLKKNSLYQDDNISLSAISMRSGDNNVKLQIGVDFHPPDGTPYVEIGSYEPPTMVDAQGGLILGTFNPPTDHHFQKGDHMTSMLTFPGAPAAYPVTVTIFLAERIGGRFHMKSISLTGLQTDQGSPLKQFSVKKGSNS
jgi:hypothetical protein